ncbi:protein of unknown function [Sanguibacter gelidistatuariae]|uniref:DUF4352 domain-containing protein n=1 Tax=Sanguibacter gelidistatuariae TaxID=1814289 RepID=A0A1G6ML76_9MICO|nr:DUF4352 domain-containing protein [Sanguibacter gelidistatuariae]SDC56034.1 protein of unknown function [Sanguibacter gelidistatuariae]
MARSRGTDPSQQAQQAYEQAQLRLAQQQAQNGQPQLPPQYVVQLAPVPKKKNFFARHKIFTALLVIVVLIALSQAFSGGDKPATTPGAGATSAAPADDIPADDAPAPTTPGIGSVVADGKFEFTVNSLEPGVAHIGDATFGVDAQGQFLLVHVTVTNIGDQAQYFDSSSQKLLDAQGRTHSADSTAAVYLPDSNSFLTSINPGNTVEGIIVFDVPADASPASLELHDSPFSGGVTVAVS